MAQFVNVLGVTVVVVALPSIGRSLQLSGGALQWVASAYALFFGGCLMVCGRAADVAGRRRLFAGGLVAFAIASLACGLATTGTALVLARCAQGLAAAMVLPAALSMLVEIFPHGRQRDRAVGVWTAVAAGGGAAGFFLGGVITQVAGWRWVFLLNVPVSLAALVPIRRWLPPDGGRRRGLRLDLPGALTSTAGLVLAIYALTGAERAGLAAAGTVGPLLLAVLLLAVFVQIERRVAHPLVPLATLRLADVTGSALAAFTLTATTSGAGVLGTLYLQGVLGYSPTATGLAYVPFSLAVVAGSAAGTRLAGRIGHRSTVIAGLSLVAVAMLILGGISAATGLVLLVTGLVVSGLGLGCASVAATSAGMSAVADHRRGVVSGLLNTAAQVGTAVGIAALLAFAAARTPPGAGVPGPQELVDGYRAAFVAAAGTALLGLVAAGRLLGRPKAGR